MSVKNVKMLRVFVLLEALAVGPGGSCFFANEVCYVPEKYF